MLARLDRTWKTFVHIDLPGTARVNADHDPGGGRCPTAAWQPGDIVVDHFSATFGGDASVGGEVVAGDYIVTTGLFRGDNGTWTNMAITDAPADLRGKLDGIKIGTLAIRR